MSTAAEELLGVGWQQLSARDKRDLLERLEQVERETRPEVEDEAAAERRAIRDGGPMRLLQLLVDDLAEASPLHVFLNDWHLDEGDRPPGDKMAVAAARGHGKTTVGCEAGAMWHVLHGTRRFIVIVSDTWTQARDRVQALATWVDTNDKLRELYPDLRPAVDSRGQLVGWRDDDLTFANGVRVRGVGANGSVRGVKQGDQRPDLLILDDLESERTVATPAAIAKLYRWLSKVALPLGNPLVGLSVLWVGSILSRAALLNLATGSALDEGQRRPDWALDWSRAVYPSELRGSPKITVTVEVEDKLTGDTYTRSTDVGTPMWPAMSRERLAKAKVADPVAYAIEYLADPVATGTPMLAPPLPALWMNPQAPPQQRLVRMPGGGVVAVAAMTRACALDPQYAEQGQENDPDLAAIAVVGQYGAWTFLLDSWAGRDRHGQAARLVSMGVRWGCALAGVEAVSAQVLTADAAADFGVLPVVRITRGGSGSKTARALGLAARLGEAGKPETCRVLLMPDAAETEHGPLTDFLTGFPRARYDDPVDAVVDALDLALRGTQAGLGGGGTPGLGGDRQRPG